MRNIFALALLFMSFVPLSAGDFFYGIRTWNATWSPGAMKKIKKDAEFTNRQSFLKRENSIEILPYVADDISGFYAGPLISYVTDNRKFSFGIVAMGGKSGSQGFTEVSAEQSEGELQDTVTGVRAEPIRTDFDFTAAYAINERIKVFAGIKSQSYEYDIGMTTIGTYSLYDTSIPFYLQSVIFGGGFLEIKHKYTGPAVGIAYSLPVSDRSALSGSLGYFKATGTSNEKAILIVSNGISGLEQFSLFSFASLNTTIAYHGITLELTYTTRMVDNLFLQVSYRGQFSNVDVQYTWADDSFLYVQGVETTSEFSREPYSGDKFRDRFQGISISILHKI